MKPIKMVDLQGQYINLKAEIDQAISEVLNTAAFIQGPQVRQFSDQLAHYLGVPFVIPVANGTDALQIALMALDLKPGDEVIVPAFTYVAPAEAVALLGLTPVFADVSKDSFNLDPAQVETKITRRTKAIIPVHLYGQCADMEEILGIAARRQIPVIEDAAQSMGTNYTFASGLKKSAGCMGFIGITSFFPSKNLGCYGDGGAIFTSDETLAAKITMIANHGQRKKYYHEIIGLNSRLDTVQAAVLLVKLKYLDQFIARRQQAAAEYDRRLKDISWLKRPSRSKQSSHTFHQYTLQVSDKNRDRLAQHLDAHGIPSMIYYPLPVHMQQAFMGSAAGQGSFPVAEMLAKTVISLPMHTELSPTELAFICDTIRTFEK